MLCSALLPASANLTYAAPSHGGSTNWEVSGELSWRNVPLPNEQAKQDLLF